MLRRTVVEGKSKCKVCTYAFTVHHDDDDQICNALIALKEYKIGAMIRPSVLANDIFAWAESIVKSHGRKPGFQSETGLKSKITEAVLLHISENFSCPTCHLKIIIPRFINARLHFWSKCKNSLAQKKHGADIISEAHASKSTKTMVAIK